MGNMPRLVSLAILLLLIVILGITFFKVVAPFLLPLFLAAMTAIVCRPLFDLFLRATHQQIPAAAGLTTATLLLGLLIPLSLATLAASWQLYRFATVIDLKEMQNSVQVAVDWLNQYRAPEEQLTSAEIMKNLSVWFKQSMTEIGDKSLSIGSAAGKTWGALTGAVGFLVTLGIGLVMYSLGLYFFLADGTRLIQSTQLLIPVNAAYQQRLVEEFSKSVRSVVMATFLAALGQGVATTLAIGVLGFHHLFALGALATFLALIPLLGTWMVWVPCAIWLFLHNHIAACVGLSLYCLLFVGFLDNLIRTYVLNSNVKLHPLLAFISVLGGIHVMGLWGVFIGPIVACCLYALIKIFNEELAQLSRERQPVAVSNATPNAEPEPEVVPVNLPVPPAADAVL